MLTVKKVLVVLLAVLAATASAQKRQTESNTGQARMRIQVVVVPTVVTNQDIAAPKDGAAVTYSIPTNPPRMTTREEIHSTAPLSGEGKPIIVRTITIVAE